MYVEDFLRFALPSTDEVLKHLASSRYYLSTPSTCEFSFVRLIEKEVELQVELEEIKQELSQSEGFSAWKAFAVLDEQTLLSSIND